MDGLFQFIAEVPTYVIDEDVFPQLSHNVEDLLECHQAFTGMDTDHIMTGGQALMLSLASLYLMPDPKGRCQDESYSLSTFMYSVVTVFVHPDQELAALLDSIKVLLSTRESIILCTGPTGGGRGLGCSVMCELPQYGYRLGTVNSKSFVGKVFLQIKWKFELYYTL